MSWVKKPDLMTFNHFLLESIENDPVLMELGELELEEVLEIAFNADACKELLQQLH